MIDVTDFAFMCEHEGHVFLIASWKGRVGSVYCGRYVRRLASIEAFRSLDGVTIGQYDHMPKSFSTVELAFEWLHNEAVALSRKMMHGMSNVGHMRHVIDVIR